MGVAPMADAPVVDTVGARRWWPAEAVDESLPASRPSPTDWIFGHERGGYLLRAGDDGEAAGTFVDVGDVVDFLFSEERGSVEITVNPDGSFEANGPIPPATHFWQAGETETVSMSVSELAKNHAEYALQGEPERIQVDAYFWSDAIPHQLQLIGGEPAFVRVEVGHA